MQPKILNKKYKKSIQLCMDFFNEENYIEYKKFNDIKIIDVSNLIIKYGEPCTIKYIKSLNERGDIFSVTDLDFSSKFLLPLVLSCGPIYMSLVKNNSNHICGSYLEQTRGFSMYGLEVLKLLDNFNICVDLKNLSYISRCDAVLNTRKKLMCSNCNLSSTSANNKLNRHEEELLVKRGALLLLNTDNLSELILSIKNFSSSYGIKNLAIEIRNLPQIKIRLIEEYLVKEGFNRLEINKLLFENANNYFALLLMR